MNLNKKSLILLCSTLLLRAVPGHALVDESGPTYAAYPLATGDIPSLSSSGSKSADPSFGTEIMRLTDGSDGSLSCANAYSYVPVFNRDSTRLAVRCIFSGTPIRTILYQLDVSAFTVSSYLATYLSGDMIWSSSNAHVIYSRSGSGGGASYGRVLNTYNVATGTTTAIKDFTSYLPTDYGLNQMSSSADNDVWAFTKVNASGEFVGFLVWRNSNNTVLMDETYSSTYHVAEKVDEVRLDKTGGFLTVQGTELSTQIWNVNTGIKQSDLVPGLDAYVHEDTGRGAAVSDCGTGLGICYRALSRPYTVPTVLPLTDTTQTDNHYAMLADNEGWALVVNENPNYSTTLPFHGEIFQVATDGSGRVRRIVHHNSSAASYDRNAFGSISRDGRFIAWTSDWGSSSGRTDVYLAKIAAAPNRPGPLTGSLEELNATLASSDTGFAVMLQRSFHTPADATGFYTRSILRLFEDSLEIGPAHTAHADVRSYGGGRFSHWVGSSPSSEALRFSALSTAESPITNNRTYRYHVPDKQQPLVVDYTTTAKEIEDAEGASPTYSYIMARSFGGPADNTTYRNQSTLRIFEDGIELKPAHSLHATIRTQGGGRFSHQKSGSYETLRFSASDNSDPRTNGKTYTYIIDTRLP